MLLDLANDQWTSSHPIDSTAEPAVNLAHAICGIARPMLGADRPTLS